MTARIREAIPTTPPSRAFFIHSASTPGAWWRVDFTPGQSPPLTCSCPHGQRISVLLIAIAAGEDVRSPRSCWHMNSVAKRLMAAAEQRANVEAVAS